MPRRRVPPRERPAARRSPPPRQTDEVVVKADASWNVRPLRGSAKEYRCPGCDQLIRPGTAHVLVWPVVKPLLSAAAIDERRHWHHHCWSTRH